MTTGNSCSANDVDRLGGSRNYIQVPNYGTCGRNTHYYGKSCQMMQINDSTRSIRGNPTPLRTWNRDSKEFCNIGDQITPPDSDTLTVDFYEVCDAGIPLPLTLDLCRWRVIVNHGLCRSVGDYTTSWSGYVEVYDLITNTMNLGRRTSFDGNDDPRTISISATVNNHFYIGPMNFTQVAFDPADVCGAGTIVMGEPSFSCNVGCGEVVCACKEPCGNGANIFYAGASCGDNAQYVLTFTNFGANVNSNTIPAGTNGQTATERPIVKHCGGAIYALAYEDAPELFQIPTDNNGIPSDTWISRGVLDDDAITTGTPAALVCEDNNVHALVRDDTNGARFYTHNPGINLFASDLRHTFDAAQNIHRLSACGDTLVASGENGSIEISENNGASWRTVALSQEMSDKINIDGVDIADVEYNAGRIWVAFEDGSIYRTDDDSDVDNWETFTPGHGTVNQSGGTPFVWAGDDVGFIAGGTGLAATWTGGLTAQEWTTTAPRINNWPAGFDARYLATPQCGQSWVQASTLLAVNEAGDQMYLGQTEISGV